MLLWFFFCFENPKIWSNFAIFHQLWNKRGGQSKEFCYEPNFDGSCVSRPLPLEDSPIFRVPQVPLMIKRAKPEGQ